MTRPEQQAQELRHLVAMVDALGLELSDAPVGKTPPLPDFELSLADGRRVGVEITEATDPEVAAAWGGARARLENAIVRNLERESLNLTCSAYLHVEALVDLERNRRRLTELAARVAAIARARSTTGLAPTTGEKLGVPELRFLELCPAVRSTAAIASSTPPVGPALIQRAIDPKMAKLDGYRALGADEYWLLVVGGRVLSGYVTLDDAQNRAFESPFERTVFLDPSDGGCAYVDTVPPRFTPTADVDAADD